MSIEDQQLLEEFAVESQEHLADIESDLLAIEAGGADVDPDLVNKVFRAVHSVKGASGFLGLQTIGSLAHALENVLNLIRGGDLVPNERIVDVLLQAGDALRRLVSDIHNSNAVDVGEHIAALEAALNQNISAATQAQINRQLRIEVGGRKVFEISAEDALIQSRRTASVFVLEFDLMADLHEKGKVPVQLINELLALGEVLDARLDHGGWGDLSAPLPEQAWFQVLLATVLDDELAIAAFDIPGERVHRIDLESLLAGSSAAGSGAAAESVAPDPGAAVTTEDVDAARNDVGASSMGAAGDGALTPIEGGESSASATGKAGSKSGRNAKKPTARTSKRKSAEVEADASRSPAITPTNIRVAVSVLDRLMNLAGELVLARNQLLQTINGNNTDAMPLIATQLDQITTSLQEAIMQTRMQPLGNTFNKFPRIVRDLSHKLGKECELTLEGNEVELDKSILEAITDPLTHLIRNSVDHGVEMPAERAAAGKPEVGQVTLRAFHQAGKVNIQIVDDGAGIDPDRLRSKIVEKGILDEDAAEALSTTDVIKHIFHPGFSMAQVVSDVSGRGVGMDVVKTNIEKLGGTIEIDTEVGRGTTMHIKLPLTLAIIPSLVVTSGGDDFCIPQVNISELVRVPQHEVRKRIERVQDAEVLRLRGKLLPLVRLAGVLEQGSHYRNAAPPPDWLPNQRTRLADRRDTGEDVAVDERRSGRDRRGNTAAGALNIIVVENAAMRYGLVVDELHDSEEIVVKPLGRHMQQCDCLAGATILGDGSVALILDVAGMAARAQLHSVDDAIATDGEQAGDGDATDHTVLLFSNGTNEHFAIPMETISRLERIHRDQIDSVGGFELLQYRGSSLPLLRLERVVATTPVELPDFLHVAVFKLRNREIGLVVPQLIDIRQLPQALDTETFNEAGILGGCILDGQTTRLLDMWALCAAAFPNWFAHLPPPEARAASVGEQSRILLAEDSDFFRQQLTRFIEEAGFTVSGYPDGQAALDALRAEPGSFDLVVTDIEMPRLDGLELTRAIKSDATLASLPVLAVTSLAGEEDVQRGKAAGVTEYLVKLDRDELQAAVRRVLGAALAQED